MGSRASCGKACSDCASDCARPTNQIDDDRISGDPAGATFEETLEDLNAIDRHLLLFCASSNISAVLWLLHLGAHWDACDANGTTCLHIACRSGTLGIVEEMLQHTSLLEAVDTAGWTPLHVAVLMGRRDIVVRLLQKGAKPHIMNKKAQRPVELCADSATFQTLRQFDIHCKDFEGMPWTFQKDFSIDEESAGGPLQDQPFFVPRGPVVQSHLYKNEYQHIGTLMFNRQPGYGLAFLVASGVLRDHPANLSTFLRRNRVDIRQVGSFLGEVFSLSHTVRLEFINAARLHNTGVISALVKVFQMLQLPDDLLKMNRLVQSAARIWWRQHERVKDTNGQAARKDPPPETSADCNMRKPTTYDLREEVTGHDLKHCLGSSDVLHQLMFSTIMLHWYIHNDGGGAQRSMDFPIWMRLNREVRSANSDLLESIQHRLHTIVSKTFIAELTVVGRNGRSCRDGPDEGGGRGPGDEWAVNGSSALAPSAKLEGWSQIVGGGFPRVSGLAGMQTVTYRHNSTLFSEVTNSSGFMGSALTFHDGGLVEPASSGPRRDDFAWLSCCHSLLFFFGLGHEGRSVCLHRAPEGACLQPTARNTHHHSDGHARQGGDRH